MTRFTSPSSLSSVRVCSEMWSTHLLVRPFVRPSVHPSVRPSIRLSLRPSVEKNEIGL